MIRYTEGDVTQDQIPGPRILAHIVNDEGGWGCGVVVAISKRWDEPERCYRSWYRNRANPDGLFPFQLGEILMVRVEVDLCVANMLAQRGYFYAAKIGEIPLCYTSLRECLKKLSLDATKQGATVIMPKIGSGLAQGDWGKIEKIIEEELAGNTVVIYTI